METASQRNADVNGLLRTNTAGPVAVISSQGNTIARGQNAKMATTLQCRVQYLDDTDPFNSTNFPEPTRPPTYTFLTNVPLINQIAGVKRLLKAPHKVSARLAAADSAQTSRCCFDWETPRCTNHTAVAIYGELYSQVCQYARWQSFMFVYTTLVVCIMPTFM